MTLSRRSLLKGAAAGAALAVGGPAVRIGAGAATLPTQRRFRAGDRPFPHLPAGHESFPQIKHVVVLMMENHSFDNHFGALSRRGVDGLRLHRGAAANWNPAPGGGKVYASPAPSTCQYGYHIGQAWDTSHKCWNHGANNGFVANCGPESMYYYTPDQFPFYNALASAFPVCDRYFCSVMAQTYPNRRFLIAGSAFGLVSDPFPTIVGSKSPRATGYGTIFDLLNAFHISWKDYFVDLPTSGLFPYVVEQNPGKVVPVADFFADCAAGTLPFFSLVDPQSSEASEENPQDAQLGAYYAYQVIDAVMKSPAWPSTVLVLNFDEHGGYYDHVPPVPMVRPDDIAPEVSDTYGDLYSWSGFRVPAVLVSPWARRDYVSHTVYDHTSVLRLMETKWNLPALSDRDANANNMLDCLDFRRPAFLEPPDLPAAVVPSGAPACIAKDPTNVIP
jgi:phospholipase C